MKLTRRDFVHAGSAVAAASLISDRVNARLLRGSTALVAPTRVLVAGFGQSNMGTFFRSTLNTIVPNANVSFYNGDSTWSGGPVGLYHPLTVGEVGDGILTYMNLMVAATGLPVLSLQGAVGGSSIAGFIPGASAPPFDYFEQFMAQINANILPTDYLIVLWDQGEGDAVGSEKPQDYQDNLKLIRDGIASNLGRPNVAMLVAGLGTMQGLTGAPNQGNSPYRWQGIRNAHFYSGIEIPHVYYSHTNIDIVRPGGDFHYAAPTITRMGERFAQGTTNLLGIGTPGFAHWEIANAATVNATQTNVNFVHSLGADFNPTSNADGWEVSGDNGANWVTATGARNSATQLQLTHSSLSTGSARLVRYQWGYNQAGNSTGPTPGYLRDNSSIAVPLTPTTWDIRPSGASSTVPCATWRNIDALTGTFSAWTSRKLLCWPTTDNYQKFVIIAVYSGFPIDPIGNALTIKVQPDVGAQVTATFVAEHPSSNIGIAIYQVLLGTDANAAQYLTVTASQPSSPFTNYVFHILDVNAASLNSTTKTGTNSSTTTLTANTTPVTANCTLNVPNNGSLIIAMNSIDVAQSGAFATYSSNFNNRWEDGSSLTLDAANVASNASSPFSVTYGTTNPSAAINMYTLMASWR